MTPGSSNAVPPTISENFSKNKRGRPRIFTEDYLKKIREISNDLKGKTDRTAYNWIYAVKSFCILDRRDPKREKYSWLLGINEHGTGCKHTILSELGRLVDLTGDEQDMVDVAELLCEEKPTTSKVLHVLRKVRNDIKKRVRP